MRTVVGAANAPSSVGISKRRSGLEPLAEAAHRLARQSRSEQGYPPKVIDATVLHRVAMLICEQLREDPDQGALCRLATPNL